MVTPRHLQPPLAVTTTTTLHKHDAIVLAITSSIKTAAERCGLCSRPPVTIELNPVPASRPRVSKWGTYYGKTYNTWRKDAEKFVKRAKNVASGPLVVLVECFIKEPKTTKRVWPRGDVDNYAKAPLDKLNKAQFEDDDQILGLWVTKTFVRLEGDEGTHITIYEIKP